MAEDQAQESEENEALPEGEEQEDAKKGGMSKLILFAGVPVVLIVVGLGAAYFLGFFGGSKEEHAEDDHGGEHGEAGEYDEHGEPKEHAPSKHEIVFYDLPDLLVNLSVGNGETRYLKLRIALELSDHAAVDKVEVVMPRVIDNFQVYLRELRLEDLDGSAGIYRMREELLKRINLSLQNVTVQDVLFKEIIVQ